jgi:hypothetical protein
MATEAFFLKVAEEGIPNYMDSVEQFSVATLNQPSIAQMLESEFQDTYGWNDPLDPV